MLRRSGLVTATSSGRNIWYQAQHATLAGLGEWLDELTRRAADAPTLARGADPADDPRMR